MTLRKDNLRFTRMVNKFSQWAQAMGTKLEKSPDHFEIEKAEKFLAGARGLVLAAKKYRRDNINKDK